MDLTVIAVLGIVLLLLAALYIRDTRVRPGAGFDQRRWAMVWGIVLVASVLFMTVAFDTALAWLQIAATVLLVLALLTLSRDVSGRRPRDRRRGRYGSGGRSDLDLDGWRGD